MEQRDHWQENEGRRMIHFLPPMFLPAHTTESVMEREADEGVRAPCCTCLSCLGLLVMVVEVAT